MKHLPEILALQRDLVKKFLNIAELTEGSITEFLGNQKAGIDLTVYISASQPFQLRDSCTRDTKFHATPNYLCSRKCHG